MSSLIPELTRAIDTLFAHALMIRVRNDFTLLELVLPAMPVKEEKLLFRRFLTTFLHELNRVHLGESLYLAVHDFDLEGRSRYQLACLLDGYRRSSSLEDLARSCWSTSTGTSAEVNLLARSTIERGSPTFESAWEGSLALTRRMARGEDELGLPRRALRWRSSPSLPPSKNRLEEPAKTFLTGA